MKIEAAIFRAVLVGACIVVLVSAVSAVDFWRQAASQTASLEEMGVLCRDGCTDGQLDRHVAQAANLVRKRDSAFKHMWECISLLVFGPAGLFMAFYAGRWIPTGRFKPLWVLGKSPQAPATASFPG